MGPKTTRLLELIDEAAALMRSVEEDHWAGWLEKDAASIRASEFHGVEHFLGAFGGMGSISDLVIHPINHHRVAAFETSVINQRLRTLLSQAYEIATELRREGIIG